MEEKIKKIRYKNIQWFNISNPGKKEINFLREKFDFNEEDLKNAYITKKAQRPEVSNRGNYLFLIFLFPIYNRRTREILPAEVDFFVGPDFLITLHGNNLPTIDILFNQYSIDENIKKNKLAKGVEKLLYDILDNLFNNLFPMLDHIAEDNQNIENNVFAGRERQMVKEILIIKRNIVNFRTIMQSHRTIVRRLIESGSKIIKIKEYKNYYDNLLMSTKDIWEILENHKETIDALQETNESSISFRLNDIMKTLTIISIIFLPLTLVASLFGMNNHFMPLVNHPAGFWIIILLMLILSSLMFLFFKIKKWL